MKKWLLVLLLLMPFVVKAECNKEKHDEYVKLSSSITYDNNYSKSQAAFTIVVYNIFSGMYIEYGGQTYKPNAENEVTITGIKGGTPVSLDIYGNDGCDQIKRIIIDEPYFNKYYGSDKCRPYVEKLIVCSSQFTSVEVTESRLDKAIYNYTHNISDQTEKNEEIVELTLFGRIKEFLYNWGLKIVLLLLTIGLSVGFYSTKFRKIKHGI